ncbi:MAG: hypothetical protein SFZ24_01165 [Planctomycetota bacterium]|nr:hypothetical protein [Planctomycetota bacterium]
MTQLANLWIPPRSPRYRACFRCGYDLRALDASALCPECAREAAVLSAPPMARWSRAADLDRIELTLRIGAVALIAFALAAGAAGAVGFFEILDDFQVRPLNPPPYVGEIVAIMISGGWTMYAGFGFASALRLVRSGRVVGEPAHLRSQRFLVSYLGLLAPVIFFTAAVTGLSLLLIFEILSILVIPTVATIVGMPALAASFWASGMLTALTRDHARRNIHRRRARRIALAFAAWILGAFLTGVGAVTCMHYEAYIPVRPVAFTAATVVLTGGLSWSFLMLWITSVVLHAHASLRRARSPDGQQNSVWAALFHPRELLTRYFRPRSPRPLPPPLSHTPADPAAPSPATDPPAP